MRKLTLCSPNRRIFSSHWGSLFATRRWLTLVAMLLLLAHITIPAQTAAQACCRVGPQNVAQGKMPSFSLIGKLGDGTISQAVWSPDGRKYAVAGSQGVHLHNADLDDRTSVVLSQNLTPANDVAFSPDGRFIASADTDGVVRVRYADGLNIFKALGQKVNGLTFSPDGKLLFLAGADSTIRTWHLFDGNAVVDTIIEGVPAYDIQINRQGTLIAVFLGDIEMRPITIIDVKTGTKVNDLEDNLGVFSGIVFTPDGKSIVAYDGSQFPDDATIKFWNAETYKLTGQIAIAGTSLAALAVSPDGRLLAVGDMDGMVSVVDLHLMQVIKRVSIFAETILDVAFNPAGNEVLIVGHNNLIARLSIPSWQVNMPVYDYMGYVLDVALSPDERLIATASDDGAVRLWDTNTMRVTRQMIQSSWVDAGYNPIGLDFSPDGSILASSGGDGSARLWRAHTGELIAQLEKPHYQDSISFNSSGSELALVTREGDAEIWDMKSRSTSAVLHMPGLLALKATFVADGKLLAIVYDDWGLRIWDPDQNTVKPILKGIRVGTQTTASGAVVVAQGADQLYLFSVNEQQTTTVPITGASQIAIASNGKQGIVGKENGEVLILDLASKGESIELAGTVKDDTYDMPIEGVDFGDRLVIAAQGKTVFVWSNSGK